LSGGQEHDAPLGRLLLETAGKQETAVPLLMDRAYSGFKTRYTAWGMRFKAAAPPKTNTADKWEYDKELYKKRNEIERFFRRIKAFRAVFTRYDKLDTIFSASVFFASYITFPLREHALKAVCHVVVFLQLKAVQMNE
jgi:transposase